MGKLIDAEDILDSVRGCIDCIFMAATDLGHGETAPIQAVALIASTKLDGLALITEYLNETEAKKPDPGSSPEPTPAWLAEAELQGRNLAKRLEQAQAKRKGK